MIEDLVIYRPGTIRTVLSLGSKTLWNSVLSSVESVELILIVVYNSVAFLK